ncbi:MAG TPA: 2-phospho-L-lactate guanylyltransferase, partial [Thermoleophilaceae bacterium]|nr:2-phospho-L-lactate guanylyltransferase [Thermoleophilaceae bacterium]
MKSFGLAKERLAGAFPADTRRVLAQAMFTDVLGALGRARNVDRVVVVTADEEAASVAGHAATVIHDSAQAGQSAAAEIGIRHALDAGRERVVLLPGDTPLLDPGELDALLERTAADGIEVGIVADRHGTGTNALVLAPPDAITPSFGPGSRARHVAAAEAAGTAHRVEPVPTIEHDVDTPDDLTALAAVLDAAGARRQQGAAVPGKGRVRVVIAGAPPPSKTIERIETELGWEFIQIYGLTETSPLLTINRTRAEWDDLSGEERAAKLVRAGQPAIGVTLKISDNDEV